MFDPGDAAIAACAISSPPRTAQDGTGTMRRDRGLAAMSKPLDIHGISEWGRKTAFKPQIKGDDIKRHTLRFVGKELILDNEKKVTRFGLEGRGTDVMGVIGERLKREQPAHETELPFMATFSLCKGHLDPAGSQLRDGLADSPFGTSQIAELEQKIKQLKMDLVEQSDGAVCREFADKFGFDTNDVDAVCVEG
ncbi:hypothetical protein BU15DRAFT_71171 [Melanogaster broomeanus]|nr:hypothetical protein BU15DRAFT_71171 [Melanogaster broomeanus]